jgi:Zn-finger nucleic acid-binding protein
MFALPAPPETAATLACPNCGAASPPAATACAYCRAALATAACPRCFGLNFLGARHCGHCGAKTDAPAQALSETRQRRCPRCAASAPAMLAHLVAETLLDQCRTCGGLWVDQTAFERLVEERDRQPTALAALGLPQAAATRAADTVAYRRCPDCGTVMARQNFARRSGIILDVCRSHGVWFDRDELPAVLEFVRSGGLDAARRREVEAQKDEARAARAERVSQQMKSALGPAEADSIFGRYKSADAFSILHIIADLFS